MAQFSSSIYDNSTFNRPEIIRFYTPTRAYVKLSGNTPNGLPFSFYTVIAKVSVNGGVSTESSSGTWQLYGDQRNIALSISAYAVRQIEWNPRALVPSGYYSGLVASVSLNSNSMKNAFSLSGVDASNPGTSCIGSACSYVKVTGPGIPDPGMVYKRNTFNAGCSLALVPAISSTVSSSSGCTSLYRINGIPIDPSNYGQTATVFTNSYSGGSSIILPGSNNGTNTYSASSGQPVISGSYGAINVSAIDAIISAIPPFAPYIFQIYDGTTGNSIYYTVRLRGRPPTTSELSKYHWVDLTNDTVKLLQPACIVGSNASFPGGSSIQESWTQTKSSLPIFHTFTQFSNMSGNSNLLSVGRTIAPSIKLGTLSLTVNSPNGSVFPSAPIPPTALGAPNNAGGRSWIGIDGKSLDDTDVYSANSFSYTSIALCTQ